MTGESDAGIDWEYGRAASDAVEWLLKEGFLKEDDCSMNVACGRGGFAVPMSRTVRVLVCVDSSRDSLDITGQRCAGGCRTELFQQDWRSYVPSRGRYDSCVMSPSYLCFNMETIRRIETVSKRGCAVVFPLEFDYRRLRKGFLQSLGVDAGFLSMPEFPDPRPFAVWLSEKGRELETRRFQSTVECPDEVFRTAIVRDSVLHGADEAAAASMADRYVSKVSRGGTVRYKFSANVVAWNMVRSRSCYGQG